MAGRHDRATGLACLVAMGKRGHVTYRQLPLTICGPSVPAALRCAPEHVRRKPLLRRLQAISRLLCYPINQPCL